jgi:hypothetical protein
MSEADTFVSLTWGKNVVVSGQAKTARMARRLLEEDLSPLARVSSHVYLGTPGRMLEGRV